MAGAAVGIAGLVWAIASHFMPKVEVDKPSVAAPAPMSTVTVFGSGNVGLGINSGTITVGAPPPASAGKP